MIDKFESLGFKDMHPMQVEALTELVEIALNLASLAEDNEIFEETAAYCDELVKLFGGSGVSMSVDISL
jgi:cobalamin biosynthesis Mg chelatase CobN